MLAKSAEAATDGGEVSAFHSQAGIQNFKIRMIGNKGIKYEQRRKSKKTHIVQHQS
jgi:hypothetical protein